MCKCVVGFAGDEERIVILEGHALKTSCAHPDETGICGVVNTELSAILLIFSCVSIIILLTQCYVCARSLFLGKAVD